MSKDAKAKASPFKRDTASTRFFNNQLIRLNLLLLARRKVASIKSMKAAGRS